MAPLPAPHGRGDDGTEDGLAPDATVPAGRVESSLRTCAIIIVTCAGVSTAPKAGMPRLPLRMAFRSWSSVIDRWNAGSVKFFGPGLPKGSGGPPVPSGP